MEGADYIFLKQTSWAKKRHIPMTGSKGNRGRRAYVSRLNQNLFEPLLKETQQDFQNGDGGELKGNPSRMQAVHSSSALAVNLFQYWKRIGAPAEIASLCGFCSPLNKSAISIDFEHKFQIDRMFRRSPNVDVAIWTAAGSTFDLYAVECKFSEPYSGRGHSGLDPKYLNLQTLWNDIPNIHQLAQRISPSDQGFTYLHAAQLVKHILGLKANHGTARFSLLYLWYDCLGKDGAAHRDEVDKFTRVARSDGIHFHHMTYQDLITRLVRHVEPKHRSYIEYIVERYL